MFEQHPAHKCAAQLVLNGSQRFRQTSQKTWVGNASDQHHTAADVCSPFNFQGGFFTWHKLGTPDAGSVRIHSFIPRTVQAQGSPGLFDFVGIGLLIQGMRCNRSGRGMTRWIHAFEREAIRIQGGQHRITSAGLATQGCALYNFGHVQRQAHRITQ
jgi:hypothetical protein